MAPYQFMVIDPRSSSYSVALSKCATAGTTFGIDVPMASAIAAILTEGNLLPSDFYNLVARSMECSTPIRGTTLVATSKSYQKLTAMAVLNHRKHGRRITPAFMSRVHDLEASYRLQQMWYDFDRSAPDVVGIELLARWLSKIAKQDMGQCIGLLGMFFETGTISGAEELEAEIRARRHEFLRVRDEVSLMGPIAVVASNKHSAPAAAHSKSDVAIVLNTWDQDRERHICIYMKHGDAVDLWSLLRELRYHDPSWEAVRGKGGLIRMLRNKTTRMPVGALVQIVRGHLR